MANPTNSSAWDDFIRGMPSPSAMLQDPFASDSQPLDQMPFSDAGDLGEAQDWFSNNLAVVTDASRRRPSIQQSPSKTMNPPRRNSQFYVPRSEFVKEIRCLTEKLKQLQESVREVQTEHQAEMKKLQTVMKNHEEFSIWSVDMNGAIGELAQQVVNLRVPVMGEDEWHMPEQEEQP